MIYTYTPVGSRKRFNGRAGTAKIDLLLRCNEEPEATVWEPFGSYYFALGNVTVNAPRQEKPAFPTEAPWGHHSALQTCELCGTLTLDTYGGWCAKCDSEFETEPLL
jgi:hypothetical protein